MKIARNQAKFERLGVSSEIIRLIYKESRLTSEERQVKYSNELRYRRAVSLWDAESEDDFASAMEAASQTEAAQSHAAELLAAARCYNDGFNAAAHGRMGADNNPHHAGSLQHAHWAKGCKEGLLHLREAGEEPAANGEVKRGRGRPRKVAVSEPAIEPDDDDEAPTPSAFSFPDMPR